jgi:hypothetical protein
MRVTRAPSSRIRWRHLGSLRESTRSLHPQATDYALRSLSPSRGACRPKVSCSRCQERRSPWVSVLDGRPHTVLPGASRVSVPLPSTGALSAVRCPRRSCAQEIAVRKSACLRSSATSRRRLRNPRPFATRRRSSPPSRLRRRQRPLPPRTRPRRCRRIRSSTGDRHGNSNGGLAMIAPQIGPPRRHDGRLSL